MCTYMLEALIDARHGECAGGISAQKERLGRATGTRILQAEESVRSFEHRIDE